MIQRIQTVYLIIAIILIAIPLSGMEVISYSVKNEPVSRNVFALNFIKEDRIESSYFFLANIILSLFGFYVIMAFKKLKKQIALAKILIGLVLFYSVLPIILALSGDMLKPGMAFYLSISSVIFIFLALRGMNKDKKSIDSLNRLR
jgi:hypothetical protein